MRLEDVLPTSNVTESTCRLTFKLNIKVIARETNAVNNQKGLRFRSKTPGYLSQIQVSLPAG